VKLFTCELGFKKTNGVQFKFANQKFLSKSFHIPISLQALQSPGHRHGATVFFIKKTKESVP